jgi:hypothetical protein
MAKLMLPTPTAMPYGSNAGGANRDGPMRPSLQAMFATPTKRDWRDLSGLSAAHEKRHSDTLPIQSQRLGLSGTVALLDLVRWMMGYPVGWLGPPWPLTGMRSSRRSRK